MILAAALAIGPAHADEKADALINEVRAATAATQSLSGDFTFSQLVAGAETRFNGTFALKRPNMAHVEIGEPLAQTVVSDGKNTWVLFRGAVTGNGTPQYQYMKRPADPTGFSLAIFAPITLFFHPGYLGAAPPVAKGAKPPVITTKLENRETIEGTEYQVIEVTQDKPIPNTIRFYVGADKRVARMKVDRKGSSPATLTYILKNVKVNPALTERDFAFTPPKDAKQLPTPAPRPEAAPQGKPGK